MRVRLIDGNVSFDIEDDINNEPYFNLSSPYFCYKTSSCSLVGLVATKSHACYLLGGTGWDWVRIPLGLNFSGSAWWRIWSLTGLPGD